MPETRNYSLNIGNQVLKIEIGKLARQANGAVTARLGDTVVLAAATMSKNQKVGADYMPLVVDYEEKFYASGKIKGSRFIKREGRPTDEAVLNGRLIDRTLRPLFDQQMRNEVQIIVTVLSIDQENDPALVGAIAASAALAISDIPWNGPIGAVRIGEKEKKIVVNPVNGDNIASSYNIFACGVEGKINMIETGANEVAKEKLFDAFIEGQKVIDQIVAFIKNIQKEIGKPKSEALLIAPDADFKEEILEAFSEKIAPALYQKDHNIQTKLQNELFAEVAKYVKEKYPTDANTKKELALAVIDSEMENIFKKSVLEKDARPDGRKLDEIRPISCIVGLLPRTHGSALFTRGETQALSIVTLGGPGMEQIIEIKLTAEETAMLKKSADDVKVNMDKVKL